MATSDHWFSRVDTQVIKSRLPIWNTLAGMVSRFVVNLLNPRDRRVSVIYELGGDCGIYATTPMK